MVKRLLVDYIQMMKLYLLFDFPIIPVHLVGFLVANLHFPLTPIHSNSYHLMVQIVV